MRFSWISLFVVLPLALSRCGADSHDNEDGDDSDVVGGSSNGGNGRGGTNGGDAGAPSNGGSSSGTTGEAGAAGEGTGTGGSSGAGGSAGSAGTGGCDERPVDVLILLDRSASMQDPPPASVETASKWELVVPPLLDALSTTAPIRWGLKTFPNGGVNDPACGAGIVSAGLDVPIADDNVEAVRQAILATTPQGPGTPTGDAVRLAAADLSATDSENPKFILLVTDGAPSCTNVTPTSPGTEGQEMARPHAVRAIADTRTAGIETFLVGIEGSDVARSTLSEMARAGGRPAPTVNPLEELFYPALDSAGVMDAVIRSATSCETPPFPAFPLPYADDFETSEAADWRFISVPWAVMDDGDGNHVLLLSANGDSETTWAVGGDRNWGDVRVEMRVKFVSGEGMILLSPRWASLASYAFVEYEAEDKPKLRNRFDGSTQDVLTAAETTTFALGQWHTVAVTLQGANATLEIDGTVIGMGAISTPVPNGGIGIAVEGGIVAIDDVRVTAP